MPIEVSISTSSGRASATVQGSDTEHVQHILSGLNLSKSQLESGLRRVRTGYRGPFMTFGYKAHIRPIQSEVQVSERCRPLAVASDTLRNRSSVSGTYSTTLREDITHTAEVNWSSSVSATAGFEIGADVYIQGSTHMSFTATTGKSTKWSKSEVVGSSRGVSVSLSPGQAVRANLVVKRRTVTVRVPLVVEIEGHVAAGYGPIENQPLTIDLVDLLKEIGRPTRYRTDAIFEIVCFTDADVELVDY